MTARTPAHGNVPECATFRIGMDAAVPRKSGFPKILRIVYLLKNPDRVLIGREN
jgi:hypothetical protein